jgi:hypothetical protein
MFWYKGSLGPGKVVEFYISEAEAGKGTGAIQAGSSLTALSIYQTSKASSVSDTNLAQTLTPPRFKKNSDQHFFYARFQVEL